MSASAARPGLWWRPLLLFVLLLSVGFGSQHYGNRQQITASLARWLPAEAADALRDVYGRGDPLAQFVDRTNRDLNFQLRGDRCELQLQQLYSDQRRSWWPFRALIPWQQSDEQHQSLFTVRCDTRWLPLLGWSALFTALLFGLMRLLPPPLPAERVFWLRQFLQQGGSWQAAWSGSRTVLQWPPTHQCTLTTLLEQWRLPLRSVLPALQAVAFERFSAQQLQWLQVGLRQSQGDLYRALQVALAGDELVFDADHGALTLHGVVITLSSTPYCYYLWYALLRQQQSAGGWFENPSVQRPDKIMAASVAGLMAQCGGHRKAINELNQHGLRAKTLDQNRNKIKDELVAVIGETLAADYLFESERDLHTGRSRYRLSTARVRINGLATPLPEKLTPSESVA